jgi:hypothetical protein
LIVSALAGHSDPVFTIQVYQHAWADCVDEGIEAQDKAYDP